MTAVRNTYISRPRTIGTIGAVMICAMLILGSCSKDKESMDTRVTLYPAISTLSENIVRTRAAVSGSSYNYVENGVADNTSIMVFAVPTDVTSLADFNSYKTYGTFRYRNDKWRSSVTAENEHTYNVYGLSPSTLPGAQNQTFNWGLTNANDYSTFGINNVAITFSGLDLLTDTDPLVCIAAAGKHTKMVDHNGVLIEEEIINESTEATQTLTDPTLTKGIYNIGKVYLPDPATSEQTQKFYRVWMALDHLYAKATLSFSVDETYDEIRDIHVKEAKMKVVPTYRTLTGAHTYSYVNGLQLANDAAFGPISTGNEDTLSVDLIRGASSTDPRDSGNDYVTLTQDYKEFGWFCFFPIESLPAGLKASYPTAFLEVVYEIVCNDLVNGGEKVTRRDTVQNNFPLNEFTRVGGAPVAPKPGDHFKVKIKVKPTYLYQLADDDAKLELIIE